MSEEDKQFQEQCLIEIEQQGCNIEICNLSKNWLINVNPLKYSYHFEYLGRPIIQYPQDIVAIQEIIWKVKPDLIIETGIAHGGSLIMSASMLALIDMCEVIENDKVFKPKKSQRKVLGIDIDIRPHARKVIEAHPMASRIQMIKGSSIDPLIIEKVKNISADYKCIIVLLDSSHTHNHVMQELKAYASLVSTGSYCVVFDTTIQDMPENAFPKASWGLGNNPKTAVWEFLKTHPEFEIDKQIQNKLLITAAQDGYLKRINK